HPGRALQLRTAAAVPCIVGGLRGRWACLRALGADRLLPFARSRRETLRLGRPATRVPCARDGAAGQAMGGLCTPRRRRGGEPPRPLPDRLLRADRRRPVRVTPD